MCAGEAEQLGLSLPRGEAETVNTQAEGVFNDGGWQLMAMDEDRRGERHRTRADEGRGESGAV